MTTDLGSGHRIQASNLSYDHKNANGARIRFGSIDATFASCLAIMGPSGSGKSTLLRLAAGVYGDRDVRGGNVSGVLLIDDELPRELSEGKATFAAMWRAADLFDHLSVLDNIELPLRCKRVSHSREVASNMAANLGLEDLLERRMTEVSGGQRVRTALARAIVQRPTHLFLDEPFAELDILTKWRVMSGLKRALRPRAATFIVTHDLLEACVFADRILLLTPRGGLQSIDLEPKQAAEYSCLDEALAGEHSRARALAKALREGPK